MRRFFYFLGNIACMILAFVGYSFLQVFYFFPKQIQKKLPLTNGSLLFVTVIVTIIILGLLFYLYSKQLQEDNDWEFNERPHWDGRRITIALFGIVLAFIVSITLQAAVGLTNGKTSANQAELNQISKQAGLSYLLMVCLVAPICEEVIFRGMFFNLFDLIFDHETPVSKWLGIITAGFIFGYMHDPQITKAILVYWALGCVLSWVYIRTKDLRYSILTHIGYNSFPFLLLYLTSLLSLIK
ncbi:type II CAAX endopeptidase family protein [Lactobacillus sp. ESL0684]|uniref:type II CAAX endopeptidase family protein n=1 Tax=Lactobacillus sp. ESL0684 TaxID=2983213 RepID=UPI0023F9EF82|nr:type II CAAX endopeptidase family protein [Lactobacillus sp. ESL0684]WEV43635.1 type II CAAX endopeptidase family protein [Lactobacillus sp. ESL0684]